MSRYKELYDYCQTLAPKVSRTKIEKKTLEIVGKPQVKAVISGLDTTVCRGLFISISNANHPLAQKMGCDIIVLARDLNYCWERFVYTKELMHLFDDDGKPTDTREKFEFLLSEFEVQQPEQRSAQFSSEVDCFWMALACLCPERYRLEYLDQMSKGHIDEYGVALQLKIPQQYIRFLAHPNYTQIINHLCS